MLIVGLTGGIASGKSTIARALANEPGVAVVDADRIAWETYRPGASAYERLVAHFGERILTPEGTIDRKALGEIVFSDPSAREVVNNVVHPAVTARLAEIAQEHEQQGVDVLIVEAALLLQSPHVDRSFFDVCVVVTVDREEQIRRLVERDGVDREEALQKIQAQTPQEEKTEWVNHVIESTGDPQETIARARALLRRLRRRAPSTD